ncbi:MAG: PDZ domain-containing protein [Myxococcales bacterium]|nr:PDZ domain-containing protein [Myxococcales bacterium]
MPRPLTRPALLFAVGLAAAVQAGAATTLASEPSAAPEVSDRPGWLGVLLDEDAATATVLRVVPGSPAEAAGLQPADQITRVDATSIGDRQQLVRAAQAAGEGQVVTLEVVRGDATVTLQATLGAPQPSYELGRALIGRPFPARSVTTLDGATLELGGRTATVVEFWATWCGPCGLAAPTVAALVASQPPDDFAYVALSDEDADVLAAHATSHATTWFLGRDTDGELSMAAWVTALPTFYVLDADGVIVDVYTGLDGAEAAAEAVARLRAGQAPARSAPPR